MMSILFQIIYENEIHTFNSLRRNKQDKLDIKRKNIAYLVALQNKLKNIKTLQDYC